MPHGRSQPVVTVHAITQSQSRGGNSKTRRGIRVTQVTRKCSRKPATNAKLDVIEAEEAKLDPTLLERLADHAYDGRPERAIVFDIAAWDINCPQHITRRFDEDEVAALFAPLHDRIDELEAEVASLRAKKDAVGLRLTSS